MDLKDLDPDDLLGAVKHEGQWRFFAGTVAEWILDYASYDPYFDPAQTDVVFRDNLLRVDESNAAQFVKAMAPHEISPAQLSELTRRDGPTNWPLSVLIDFDEALYVNGFSEIPLHEYVPPGWTAKEDFPLRYLPDALRSLWEGA
jgi:hypothetical protein